MPKPRQMKKKTAVKFSDRLKFIRNDLLHKKQREMAILAGISHSTYSKLETGILAPAPKMLEKLAKVLGVSLLWLKDGTGKPPRELCPKMIRRRNQDLVDESIAISDDELEHIIALATDEKYRGLADDIAATTGTSAEDALVELISETINGKPPQNPVNDAEK